MVNKNSRNGVKKGLRQMRREANSKKCREDGEFELTPDSAYVPNLLEWLFINNYNDLPVCFEKKIFFLLFIQQNFFF